MVTQAKNGDQDVDFRMMRFLCLKVPSCVPQSTPAELAELAELGASQDPRETIRISEKLLNKGFVNLELQPFKSWGMCRVPLATLI